MNRELAAFSLAHPAQLATAVRNFGLTVWDPFRSDIRQGVNALIYGAVRDATPARITVQRALAPETARLYDQGYDPELDPSKLETLPEGTLGREYVRFVRDAGIEPLENVLQMGAPANFLEYFVRRAYKLHDVLHVVLGCEATILGEVRIVSFSLGQVKVDRGHAAALALLVLMLNLLLKSPWRLPEAIRLSRQWHRLGRRTPHYTGFRLEDVMDRPVDQVRAMVLGT